MIFEQSTPSLNQPTGLQFPEAIQLHVKREDLIHSYVSGNKFRKLKYLIAAAKKRQVPIVTFGGAYSNHILATAVACKLSGLQSVGVIRGEELETKFNMNPTLRRAAQYGMQFLFVTRDAFRQKSEPHFEQQIKDRYGDCLIVPEGGTSALAVKGCQEILTQQDQRYSHICAAVGTGGTIAGLVNCSKVGQQVLGFSALKGDFLQADICKFTQKDNWKLISDYHFGGYAKVDEDLIHFINNFKINTGILLDPVYTSKMIYGIVDLISKGYFAPQSRILAIHTGGLQGIAGMNQKLRRKGLPIINTGNDEI